MFELFAPIGAIIIGSAFVFTTIGIADFVRRLRRSRGISTDLINKEITPCATLASGSSVCLSRALFFSRSSD